MLGAGGMAATPRSAAIGCAARVFDVEALVFKLKTVFENGKNKVSFES